MFVEIFLLLSLFACSPLSLKQKVEIPRIAYKTEPIEFKTIKSSVKEKCLCFDEENLQALLYNIKMSRIYYNQQVLQNQNLRSYYERIIGDLGGDS